jgi:hypothetical protein
VQFVRTPPQRISLWLNGSESEQIGIRKVTVSRICLIASTWEYQVLKMYAPTLTFPIHTYSSIFPNAMASPSSRLYAAPPMERREFSSWDEFFSYMEEYQQKTDQVRCPPSPPPCCSPPSNCTNTLQTFSRRTATSVKTRNQVLMSAAGAGRALPSQLLPESFLDYVRMLQCSHKLRGQAARSSARWNGVQPSECQARVRLQWS